MKTFFKNFANPLIMATLIAAMAITFSCTTDALDDLLNTSSSSDGSGQGGGNSSSGGAVNPSSSARGNNPSSASLGGATMEEAALLTAGQWTEGRITAANGEAWYKVNGVAGMRLYFWWDEPGSGPRTYDLDVKLTFYYNFSGEIQTYEEDDIGDESVVWIEPDADGPIYIKVVPFSEENTGSFGIVYNTTNIMPASHRGTDQDNAILLTEGGWKGGKIYSEDDEIWYKLNVTANKDYYIWLDDYDTDDYKMDVGIIVYDSNGISIFDDVIDDIGRYEPQVIRLPSSGTVYINVFYMSEGETPYFYIRYNSFDDSDAIWGYGD
jgi:hypothetical protein